MAPEQFLAQSLDCRADLFAVGVVMWEALTGKLLFAADGYDQSAINVMKKEVPPPSAFGAPSCLDEVCLRALSRARDSRYFNAEEMASALLRTAVGANLVASPRDVAQIVRMECGEVLAERRKKIQAAFAETEPAVAPVAAAPTAQLGSVRRMEPAKDQEVGEAEAPFETSPYQSLLQRLKNARIMAKPHLYVPVGLALGTLLLFTMMFVFRWPSGSLTRQDRPVREPAHAASR
jgi:serine/threonine-protein kinase